METNAQIWDKEKGFNFAEAIKPEFIEQPPSYDYGRSQESLDYNRLRNKPSWWSKTLYFTRLASVWTWIQSFNGFWFTPKGYIIQAWYKWSIAWTSTSYCTYFDWVVWWFYQYPDLQNENTLRAININNAWATIATKANFSAFTSDWITLDFVESWNNIGFTITAFA